MALIALKNAMSQTDIKKGLIKVFFCFLFVSFFLAWQDEYEKRVEFESAKNTWKDQAEYRQKRIDKLTDLLHARSSTNNKTIGNASLVLTEGINSPIFSQSSNVIKVATSGSNSPEINQTAQTIVQSFNQQGGITATSVVVITNTVIFNGKEYQVTISGK